MSEGGRRVCVVTGSRAEFGLLRTVMDAVASHPALALSVVAAGSHFLKPGETIREVEALYAIDARVEMQRAGESGRTADAAALGRGVQGFSEAFSRLRPAWVVVLGDRIEAFAAACAAGVGGWALAHIHGGDRAEGVADEGMRHAITKLAHLHLAATAESGARIARMGEREERIVVTGSPAIDGLHEVRAASGDEAREWMGVDARTIVLMHPCGLSDDEERGWGRAVVDGVGAARGGDVAVFAPNHDAGREALVGALRDGAASNGWKWVEHLPRERFIAVLKRLAASGGLVVGNSSAGLIECAALGVRAVNMGPRQNGRERSGNVVDVERAEGGAVGAGIERAAGLNLSGLAHPYGDGRAGARAAEAIARAPVHDPGFLRKCNAY